MAVRKGKTTRSSTKIKRVRKREKDYKPQELCCCPPRAMVWIDTRTSCCFIENQIDMKRQLLARADAVASVQPPAGPSVNAESGGGTQFDEATFSSVIDVNLKGTFFALKHAAPIMERSGGGVILCIASGAGVRHSDTTEAAPFRITQRLSKHSEDCLHGIRTGQEMRLVESAERPC